MMRSLISGVLAILFFTTIAEAHSSEYCDSKGRNSNYFWVNSLNVNGDDFETGQNGGYYQHQNTPSQLETGNNSIVLKTGYRSYAYRIYWRGWLDINHDNVFSSNEQVFQTYGNSSKTITFDLPSTYEPGVTTLRVAMKYGGYPNACETYYYGETEDVLVQLGEGEAPAPDYISHSLTLDYDFTVHRDGSLADKVSWVIEKNGVTVLQRNAKGELDYRYYSNTLGSDIVIWLEQYIDGDYQQVSNAVQYTPGTSDLYELDLQAGYELQRSGALGDSVQWVIEKDGEIVLQRNAANELNYTYYRNDQGSKFRVWLKQYMDGEYKVVSNVVEYEVGQAEFTLTVDSDFGLTRNGQLGDAVQWVIEKDGETVLQRNAANELDYTYLSNTPGASIRVWLKMYVDGVYQVVSNVVEYTVPASYAYALTLGSNYTLTRSGALGDGVQWVIVKNGNVVLQRNASNELSYRYFSNTAGSTIEVYLQQFKDGAYRHVSNTVKYTVN